MPRTIKVSPITRKEIAIRRNRICTKSIPNQYQINTKVGMMKYRRSHYSGEDLIEFDRLIGNIKRHIRESLTFKKIINPGWRQWSMRIACFSIIHFREGIHRVKNQLLNDRGDVPGWVLVVLMTTGLVTAIWTLAAPRIQSILRSSLDSMNNIR